MIGIHPLKFHWGYMGNNSTATLKMQIQWFYTCSLKNTSTGTVLNATLSPPRLGFLRAFARMIRRSSHPPPVVMDGTIMVRTIKRADCTDYLSVPKTKSQSVIVLYMIHDVYLLLVQ